MIHFNFNKLHYFQTKANGIIVRIFRCKNKENELLRIYII